MAMIRKCIFLKLFKFDKIKYLMPLNILPISHKNITISNLDRYKINAINQAIFNTTENLKFRKFDRKYFDFIHQDDSYKETTVRDIIPISSKINLIDLIDPKGEKLKLSDEQLKETVTEFILNKDHNDKILSFLDDECGRRAIKWTVAFSLYILDAWILIDEQFALHGKFFNILINLWCTQIRFCTKENLVQMIYYLGRSKKPAIPLLIKQLETAFVKNSANINLTEWGIICTALFKMKTKIKLEQLLQSIVNNIKSNIWIIDKFDLISMLKVLRQSLYYEETFFRLLEDYVKKEYFNFTVAECVHIIATFANVGWYDDDTFRCLEVQVLKHFENNLPDIRLKDISKFLWALSHVNHKCQTENFYPIVIKMIKKFNKISIKNYHYLIDCAHSLIILDYYDKDILNNILSIDFIKLMSSSRNKPFHQLYFIDRSIRIEVPSFQNTHLPNDIYSKVHNLPLKSVLKDMTERYGYQDLLQILKIYCCEKELYQCLFILPHIAISSICLEAEIIDNTVRLLEYNRVNSIINKDNSNKICNVNGNHLHICFEILDRSLMLKSKNEAIGLINTKIRQLRKLDYGVVVLTSQAIIRMKSLPIESLKSYFDDLILKVSKDLLVTIK